MDKKQQFIEKKLKEIRAIIVKHKLLTRGVFSFEWDDIEPILQSALSECWDMAGKITGETSDGYHTFNELYDFRKTFNAVLFNEWSKQGKYSVHKSKKHYDGQDCFGGGWFIVMATLPTGQISNHYELKDWDMFQCEEREKADEWDGHTAKDVLNRLNSLTSQKEEKVIDHICSWCERSESRHDSNYCYKCKTDILTSQKEEKENLISLKDMIDKKECENCGTYTEQHTCVDCEQDIPSYICEKYKGMCPHCSWLIGK